MVNGLSALDPKEIVLLVVAGIGLVPVVVHYTRESRWFTLGYVLLVVGAVSTNVEALVLHNVFNTLEHGVGLMGAGIAFLVAAYVRRRDVLLEGEAE